jgi:hypothetical protein
MCVPGPLSVLEVIRPPEPATRRGATVCPCRAAELDLDRGRALVPTCVMVGVACRQTNRRGGMRWRPSSSSIRMLAVSTGGG